jgi:hypothetical protein
MNGMDELDEAAAREIAAFVERFNYFRKPYNQGVQGGWKRNHGLAGDAVVHRAITGHGDIGLLMNKRPRFICFDVDLPGKGGEVAEPSEGNEEEQEGGSEERAEQGGPAEPVGREAWDEEGPFPADPGEWPGWAELGIGAWEAQEELARGLQEAHRPVMPEWKFQHELEPETRRAVEALLECFNERPSLVVKSPHGAHVYWCLEEEALWYQLRPKLVKVKRAWEEKCRERGIKRNLEVLPTPERPLRIPRLDRLLEPEGLSPMGRPADGEAFWRGLRVYRLEGLIKDEVLGRAWPKEERPGLRLGEEGGGKKGQTDTEILSLRPKDRMEAEELLMPFREGQTNGQLIKMIEGGKRGGMTLDDVTEWILGWETRSRAAGYSGDLFDDKDELMGRIETLFERSTATAAGATRFIKLWDRKKGDYGRDAELAERLLGLLERKSPQPKQSRQAMLRFFADLDVWRRIIDDAVADPASGIDDVTIRNQNRGAYPLPYELRRRMYSSQGRIWAEMETLGMVVKDDQSEGHYVPDLGRPQYYRLENILKHGAMGQGDGGA